MTDDEAVPDPDGVYHGILWRHGSLGVYRGILWRDGPLGVYRGILWRDGPLGVYRGILWRDGPLGVYRGILWRDGPLGVYRGILWRDGPHFKTSIAIALRKVSILRHGCHFYSIRNDYKVPKVNTIQPTADCACLRNKELITWLPKFAPFHLFLSYQG